MDNPVEAGLSGIAVFGFITLLNHSIQGASIVTYLGIGATALAGFVVYGGLTNG